MMPGTEHDVDDLVWHGRALRRALHRAWEAEVEAAELRAREPEEGMPANERPT